MCVWHIGSIFFRSGVFGSKPPLLITIPCSQLVGVWLSLSGHARSDLNFEVNYPWLKIVLGCVTSQDSSATKTYKLTLKGGNTLVMPWKGISVILSLHILPPNFYPLIHIALSTPSISWSHGAIEYLVHGRLKNPVLHWVLVLWFVLSVRCWLLFFFTESEDQRAALSYHSESIPRAKAYCG
jgi:hypothetical protein